MTGRRVLSNPHLRAVVDLDRGAEIASLVHVASNTGILLRTPWADAAEQRRPTQPTAGEDSRRVWTESYAGGWQVLFPHAGSATVVDGTERGYHGEASLSPWTLVDEAPDRLRAEVRLSGVPVHLRRTISLADRTVLIADQLTNESDGPVRYVYQHHPALGAPFLEAGCHIDLPAGRTIIESTAGDDRHDPDLLTLPGLDRTRVFAGLDDLTGRSARVWNHRLGLAVSLIWEGPELAHLWYWRESGATESAPWSGLGYALAIEPSTTPPGDARLRLSTLEAGGSRSYAVALRVDSLPPSAVPTPEVTS